MLVLSRKVGERIKIDENITLVVVEIRGDKCRLGIDAPPSVPVHRAEVYDAIHRDNGTNKSLAGRRPVPPAPLSGLMAGSATVRAG